MHFTVINVTIVALDPVNVKPQNFLSLHVGILSNAMYHHRRTSDEINTL